MEGKGVRRHNVNNLWIVLPLPSGSFGVISLALPRVSKRLTMGRSAEGEIKHACRLVSLQSEAAGVSSLG